jgi:hypothetical protein
LNKFYSLLHTPVGEEYKLREKGIDMILEGDSNSSKDKNESSLEENGHSLLLVDLLELHKKFSFKRYKIDLQGFAAAFFFVIGIFVLGLITANLG